MKLPPQEPQIKYIQIPASEDADELIFGKYEKMRTVGVPLIAVRQKIELEGLDFDAFEAYMKRKKSAKAKSTSSASTVNTAKLKPKPMLGFSMNDLLGQRKNLKKAKKRKKIIDNDNGFLISSAMKQANSKVLVPTLQDIIGSMKSLKSTGIKLH